MNRAHRLFLALALFAGFSGAEEAGGLDSVKFALDSAGIAYETPQDGLVSIPTYYRDIDKRFSCAILDRTFQVVSANFRMVSSGWQIAKPRDLTDEQLEWLLVQNGKNTFGGYRLFEDSDTVCSQVAIPALPRRTSAAVAAEDGKTIFSAASLANALALLLELKCPKKAEVPPPTSGGNTGIRPTTLENVKTMLESEGIEFKISDNGKNGFAKFRFGRLGFTLVSVEIVDGAPQLNVAKLLPYPIPPTLRTAIQSATANSAGNWTLSEHENLSASYLVGKETIAVSATPKQLAASAKAFAEIIVNVESALEGKPIAAAPTASSPGRSPSAATPATGVSPSSSVEQILAKAEDHDGVVLGGFYLGMSPEDALALCKHYFGHLGTIGIVKHVEKHSNSNLRWHLSHTNISPYLGTDDWVSESIVLRYGPGEQDHWTICEISCEQQKGSTDQWRWDRGAKKAIYYFRFSPKMMRALIGKKNVMSSRELGRSFLRKFDLDGDADIEDNIKFDTPEGEHVWFICHNPGPDIRFYCDGSPYRMYGTMIANFDDVKSQLAEP